MDPLSLLNQVISYPNFSNAWQLLTAIFGASVVLIAYFGNLIVEKIPVKQTYFEKYVRGFEFVFAGVITPIIICISSLELLNYLTAIPFIIWLISLYCLIKYFSENVFLLRSYAHGKNKVSGISFNKFSFTMLASTLVFLNISLLLLYVDYMTLPIRALAVLMTFLVFYEKLVLIYVPSISRKVTIKTTKETITGELQQDQMDRLKIKTENGEIKIINFDHILYFEYDDPQKSY